MPGGDSAGGYLLAKGISQVLELWPMSMCRRSGVVQAVAPKLRVLHGFPLLGLIGGQGTQPSFPRAGG